MLKHRELMLRGTHLWRNFAIMKTRTTTPNTVISALPVVALMAILIGIIATQSASAVQDFAPWVLLGVSGVAVILTALFTDRSFRLLGLGIAKSARQILPAIPLLICIAMLSTTWMLSGIVPLMIKFGLDALRPELFLLTACAVSAIVSVLTGSSWTTIATVGVAFTGIGTVMGYSPGWVAGAVISGAYFGDKISPLSDTTVLAASSCGLDLFRHIRFLLYTTVPSMATALAVFTIVGLAKGSGELHSGEMVQALQSSFNLSPWLLLVPAVTLTLILCRVPSLITLAAGALGGLIAMAVFQPQMLAGSDAPVAECFGILLRGASPSTSNAALDPLVSTSGIAGMLTTMLLVGCAMVFGGVMIGSGMLGTLTRTFTRLLRRPRSLVGATVASGLFLNGCTGDQYLSIIIGGNIYRSSYRRHGLADEMLSRSLEDSISVTSVLIPWNSCGVTQSAVLGVATLTYLPYCIFNLASPLMSVLFAWIGFKVRTAAESRPAGALSEALCP